MIEYEVMIGMAVYLEEKVLMVGHGEEKISIALALTVHLYAD